MFRKHVPENLPFWLLISGIMILLTAPKLIQDGMFADAVMYSCVSHNLSMGVGTFWFPQFSPSLFAGNPFFLEHPPLVFGIQSLFFRLFGDSMYVERFYVFLTMCISAFLISLLWRDIYSKVNEKKNISWLPLIFWAAIPAWFWTYSNNMLENTMAIFDLCAVILIYRASESALKDFWKIILAGFFIFFATLSKGLPGLFPVAVPFLHWMISRKKSLLKTILNTTILLIIPLLIYLFLFNLPQSKESLTFYSTNRLWERFHDIPTVNSRLYIMKRLFNELILPVFLAILILITAKIKKLNTSNPDFRKPILFFSIGLSASIPLALTLFQRGFYLVPSFPYFAIAIAFTTETVILYFKYWLLDNKLYLRIFTALSVFIFALSIGYTAMQKGKAQRDREMLHDVHAIGNSLPYGTEITVSQDIASTYVVECYFIRYYYISLHVNNPKEYILVKKTNPEVVSAVYEKQNIETRIYDLYKQK